MPRRSHRPQSWIWKCNAVLALAARMASADGTAADTGQIATLPGLACNGRDASRLQNIQFPSLDTLGHLTSIASGVRIADDFQLSGTTLVKTLTFYAFGGTLQDGTCHFDDVRVQIWNAKPNGVATKVFGDTATNRFASCEFANTYRDSEATPGICLNPVMAITATINAELDAGTYWADFMVGESNDFGFVVPVTLAGFEGGCGFGNCNAITWDGDSWATLEDASNGQDVKIVVGASYPKTIHDGDAVFARAGLPFDATPEAGLTGVAQNPRDDQVFEAGWAYRVAGDTRETFFPTPILEFYGGDGSQINWTDVDGNGFAAVETTTIVDQGLGAYVVQEMALTNIGGSPLTIDLFHTLDMDVLPGFADDTARLVAWTPLRVIEMSNAGGAPPIGHYAADSHASHFLVRPNGAAEVGALLNDASVTDFDDSGVPVSGIDVTAGYQFPLTIPAGETESAVVVFSVNYSLQCDGNIKSLYCDGFEYDGSIVPPWSAKSP